MTTEKPLVRCAIHCWLQNCHGAQHLATFEKKEIPLQSNRKVSFCFAGSLHLTWTSDSFSGGGGTWKMIDREARRAAATKKGHTQQNSQQWTHHKQPCNRLVYRTLQGICQYLPPCLMLFLSRTYWHGTTSDAGNPVADDNSLYL